ncbi:MAG: hypothetical protein KC983_03885, partial [Phycisphaerales bacterium]|nr:hypothetical protein [Phycisphaerales bacterium]
LRLREDQDRVEEAVGRTAEAAVQHPELISSFCAPGESHAIAPSTLTFADSGHALDVTNA